MHRPFREHHLLTLLEQYEQGSLPLDLSIRNYFRANKALGSKDRGFIAEKAYALMRWKGLLDYLAEKEAASSWETRLALSSAPAFETAKQAEDIPLHIRVSAPQLLFDLLAASHGIEKAAELCLVNNTPAPVTIRVNPLKITRTELLQRWKDNYGAVPCQEAPYGIRFDRRLNFFELPEFKAGFFEVQDEGSQLVAALVEAEPGQQVLDYCAGAGGKTLAFAPQMDNKGQIHLYDVRKHALEDCRKRLRRAGIQNAQAIFQDEAKLKKLKKRMDWVLVDAPCTGTGTLRRNPDMKWKFDDALLKRLVSQQRVIFEKALSYLKPEGKIVYATCSLLKEENEEQLQHFIDTYGLELAKPAFHSLPSIGGMDGFYAAVLRRKG
jgi:16S rRNA (cytosine(967)-C(5))-methyltransferase